MIGSVGCSIPSKLIQQVKAFLSDEEVDHFMKLLEARVVRCWMHRWCE